MWFKQLSVYAVPNIRELTEDKLAAALAACPFTPCTGLSWDSYGFVVPCPFCPDMVFRTQDVWRIALKTEEKVLPAAVVRDILQEKINHIRQFEGRVVGWKEKQELKEDIVADLLPRALTRSRITAALFDMNHGLLLVDQANTNRAEMLLTRLRDALGCLEARLPRTQQSVGSLMTDWLLNGRAAGGFELDSDCELKGLGDAVPVVRISHQDLTAEEVINHVRNGKVVTQLGLSWRDQLRFVLTQDFTLKRIQFLDGLREEAAGQGDDMASLMFASQLLMAEALSEMVEELVGHLGGWINE